ncbi:MAG: DEAD/DEAH box helicase, partial [Clostridia bacterium]|nr:DEAD/DEAH box helicase [Clostridia bacterium]
IKDPPNILITTPESLFLLLTSPSGALMLQSAKAIIIDELHAVISTKRGAHLMLSLARLDLSAKKPLQRIGLSATIKPLELAAAYLSPTTAEDVTVAAPAMEKSIKINIIAPHGGSFAPEKFISEGSVWPALGQKVYDHTLGARSVIAFCEGRQFAEKLAFYVNQIAQDEDFAKTHHGSLAKEKRHEVEMALRAGTLRLLCATSSMELGIDVGEIDRVLQIGCPRTVSSTLQRLGRAGHNPGRTSVMSIFPRTPSDALYAGLTAQVARQGGVELCRPPRMCLDVLAQHAVSMAVTASYTVDDILNITTRAQPFRDITRENIVSILHMLDNRVQNPRYARMLASGAGGTIPDRGMFAVRTQDGVKVGELEEEYVFEARFGDKILLGAFAWRIVSISKDAVTVSPANTEGAQPPWWKGDTAGRDKRTGEAFGELMRGLYEAQLNSKLTENLQNLGLDENAALAAQDLLQRQIKATGLLPDHKTIIIEHFRDETGAAQMMLHSVFGKPVNAPLGVLLHRAANTGGEDIGVFDDDDGCLLFKYSAQRKETTPLPDRLLFELDPATVKPLLEALLPGAGLFAMAFRYNAARALMMGLRSAGKPGGTRQPLWIQRLRSAELLDSIIQEKNHPLIEETRRECMEDYWDVEGLIDVLTKIHSGEITVRELRVDTPSPLALPLRRAAEAELTYNYTPTTRRVMESAENALREAARHTREERMAVAQKRKEIKTVPAVNYAALMAGRLRITAPPAEQLAHALRGLSGVSLPALQWENSVLPLRVDGYRPAMLDGFFHSREMFWKLCEGQVVFYLRTEIDWETPPEECDNVIYKTLLQRGACFVNALAQDGESVYEPLMSLMEQGLVHADSFAPVRMAPKPSLRERIGLDDTAVASARSGRPPRGMTARIQAMTAGRWEAVRPLREVPLEERILRQFNRAGVLCYNTAGPLPWQETLDLLRKWEYQDRVRRGYFVADMAGAQFVLAEDFEQITQALDKPRVQTLWLPANDPAQPYGRALPHDPEHAFERQSGAAVCLHAGAVAAVVEGQGRVLRVFDDAVLPKALSALATEFGKKRLFSMAKKLSVKQYPPQAAEALRAAGFLPDVGDFVLYREFGRV